MVLTKTTWLPKRRERKKRPWLEQEKNPQSMENFISTQVMTTETKTCVDSCKRKLTCTQIINSAPVCIATTSTVIPWISTTKSLTSRQPSKVKPRSQLIKFTLDKKMKSINILRHISNQKVFSLEVLQLCQLSSEELQIRKKYS